MRLFKTTYTTGAGQKTARKWYLEFRDHLGTVRRLPAFTDKRQSEDLGRQIERLIMCRSTNSRPDLELTKWVETMPPKLRDNLARIGLLDAAHVASYRGLSEHLKEYRQTLEAQGCDPKYIRQAIAQIERVNRECGFTFWGDVDAMKVERFLLGLREGENGIKLRTNNDYITAVKAFAAWAVQKGRISSSPLATLSRVTVTDATERRALDVDEVRWLLATTETAGERHGMSGAERALCYRLAIETGLRANELRSLTRASFLLAGDTPTVTVEKGSTKNRQGALIDLSTSLAKPLADHLETKMPGAAAFNIPDSDETASMLRDDLTGARDAWLATLPAGEQREAGERSSFLADVDAAGRVVVFHSLRHTRGVWLAQQGASFKELQELMRLSDAQLVARYTKSFRMTGRRLVDGSPDLSPPSAFQQQRATGTHDAAPLMQNLAKTPVENSACFLSGSVDDFRQLETTFDGEPHAATIKTPLGNGVTVAQQSLNLNSPERNHVENQAVSTNPPGNSAGFLALSCADADISTVVDAWSKLSAEVRAKIMALVRGGQGESDGGR